MRAAARTRGRRSGRRGRCSRRWRRGMRRPSCVGCCCYPNPNPNPNPNPSPNPNLTLTLTPTLTLTLPLTRSLLLRAWVAARDRAAAGRRRGLAALSAHRLHHMRRGLLQTRVEARRRQEAMARWALHPNPFLDPNLNPNPNPNLNFNPSLDPNPNPNQVGGAESHLGGAVAVGADCAAGVTEVGDT